MTFLFSISNAELRQVLKNKYKGLQPLRLILILQATEILKMGEYKECSDVMGLEKDGYVALVVVVVVELSLL